MILLTMLYCLCHDGIILFIIIIILSEYYYEAKIWWVLIIILSYNINNNKTFYRDILGILLVVNAIYFWYIILFIECSDDGSRYRTWYNIIKGSMLVLVPMLSNTYSTRQYVPTGCYVGSPDDVSYNSLICLVIVLVLIVYAYRLNGIARDEEDYNRCAIIRLSDKSLNFIYSKSP